MILFIRGLIQGIIDLSSMLISLKLNFSKIIKKPGGIFLQFNSSDEDLFQMVLTILLDFNLTQLESDLKIKSINKSGIESNK